MNKGVLQLSLWSLMELLKWSSLKIVLSSPHRHSLNVAGMHSCLRHEKVSWSQVQITATCKANSSAAEEPKPTEVQGGAVSQAFFSSHPFYFTTATKEERRGNKTKPKIPQKTSSTCCPLLQHLRFEQLNFYGLAS